MPLLAARYRVIAPDLRGLGDSSRPPAGYDKKTVAADLWQLLSGTLGLARWHLVGHDWGGPVAFALAAAHPEAIRTLTIVDVTLPGIGPDISQGGKRWHHAFHMTPDLPEALVQGRERAYLSWFYESFSWQRGVFGAADIDEYLRTYTQPGALRAGFAFYRNIPRRHRRQPRPARLGPAPEDAGARGRRRPGGSARPRQRAGGVAARDRRRRHRRGRRRLRPLRSRRATRRAGGAAARVTSRIADACAATRRRAGLHARRASAERSGAGEARPRRRAVPRRAAPRSTSPSARRARTSRP